MRVQIRGDNYKKEPWKSVMGLPALLKNNTDKTRNANGDLLFTIHVAKDEEELYEKSFFDAMLVEPEARVDGLTSRVEEPVSTLDDPVPVGWPNSIIIEYEDQGETDPETGDPIDTAVPRQKLFREYCAFIISTDMNDTLLEVGWRDESGNRPDEVMHEELLLWVDEFGANSILVPFDWKPLIKADYQ